MRGPTNPSRLLKVLLCLLAVASLAARGGAADSFPADGLAGARIVSFAATDMEVTDYADNSLEPDAVWKIKSVSPEHRRMGFFSVKLLPVMVVRDIQLNFTSPRPQTNWLDDLHCEWVPVAKRAAFEGREFSVCFPGENTPRLQAQRVYPVTRAGPLVCRLEGVTLQTASQPVHLARAEVRAEVRAGAIVWHVPEATIQWDLFSGQFTTNSILLSNQK
jgi:hypothetical protein